MPEEKRLGGKDRRSARPRQALRLCAALACLAATAQVFVLPARAQGPILSVQPTATVQALAGNGTLGYSGNGTAATAATLATPASVAYDAAGNLYIADSNNHVIRKVDAAGSITTVAGSGIEGFAGDGGPATGAMLDTPTGVAVDASGNLYIADSHNQRIRRVNPTGSISTVAGNGTASYSGDGAAATAASLFLPQAVAVDGSGNLYIADTGNYRIRKVTGGMIATVAGDGEQIFSGDGGPATSAGLDTPTGVAVDAGGNLYIADSHNQRIREAAASGVIDTIAGNGALGYSGDSGSATAAALAQPTAVSVDAAGNVYIADSGNNVIRQVGNGVINTAAGNGSQGYGGDGAAALSASLDTPRSTALDALGNVAIADSRNQRVRALQLPALTFAAQPVGSVSAPQSITLSNTGGASLQIQSLALTGSFRLVGGGTCAPTPIVLAVGSSCTQAVAFEPVATGAVFGSLVVNGSGLTPQTVLLSGNASEALDSLRISGPATTVYGTGTLIATLTSGYPTPTGTVTFSNGPTVLGSAPLTENSAVLSTVGLVVGHYSIAASYSGDVNDPTASSAAFPFSVTQAGTTTALTASGASVVPGQSVMLTAQVTSATTGTPTGTVSFYDNGALLDVAPLSGGAASFSTAALAPGIAHIITAVYDGDTNFTGSSTTSTATVTVAPLDFTMTLSGPSVETAIPGSSVSYKVTVTPQYGAYAGTVSFAVSGLPPGATVSFSPASIAANGGAQTITVTIQTAAPTVAEDVPATPATGRRAAPFVLAILLLFGAGNLRRRGRALRRLLCVAALLMGGAAATLVLSGCGASNGFLTQSQRNYTVTITATAGSLQHTATVTLNVQ